MPSARIQMDVSLTGLAGPCLACGPCEPPGERGRPAKAPRAPSPWPCSAPACWPTTFPHQGRLADSRRSADTLVASSSYVRILCGQISTQWAALGTDSCKD